VKIEKVERMETKTPHYGAFLLAIEANVVL